MTSRFPFQCVSLALTLFFGHPQIPAHAQELSAKELRKVVKQAEKAFGAARYGEAVKLYDQILASTSGTDPRRGDALYRNAMIRLSAGTGHRDVGAARRHVDELAAFPPDPGRLAVAGVRDLLAELDSASAEAERRSAELEETIAAHQAEREQAEAEREEAAGESEAAGGRVRSLESRLRKARDELAGCQTELEKKEQALQKLRDALVGGS